MSLSLQVSISEAMDGQCSALPSEPANRAFFRVSAMGRMERSTVVRDGGLIVSRQLFRRERPLCGFVHHGFDHG
jgi:hypothetical protein